MRNVILCVAFGNKPLTQMTYESMLGTTTGPYKAVYLNNGSPDNTQVWMDAQVGEEIPPGEQRTRWYKIPPDQDGYWREIFGPPQIASEKEIIFSHSKENGGCGKGRNICSRIMLKEINEGRWPTPDYVTFIDNDIVLTSGWDTYMMNFMDQHPEIGACGPSTNFAGNPQGLKDPIRVSWSGTTALPEKPEEIEMFSRSFHEANKGQWKYTPSGFIVIGFVLMIRWKAFKDLILDDGTLFDDRFKGYGFDDTLFCHQLTKKGWKLAYVMDTYVHHWGSRSVSLLGEDFSKYFNENKAVYEEELRKMKSQ